MTFVSYSQNFEDVMLWRALKNVNKGFYVDVGAAWPDEHSVTNAFYERGWRGINVEPNPQFYQLLEEQRQRDINLNLAISDHDGSLCMNLLSGTGLSTLDAKLGEEHLRSGWDVKKHEVQVRELATILEQHLPEKEDVHFLKVDVEGFEEAVLRSNDWNVFRPWIVLVESTLPLKQIESYQSWEPILTNAGYNFAYADGLNRFYVSNEHRELLDAFQYPPNVFDDFVLHKQRLLEVQLTQAKLREEELEGELSCVLHSRSWRLTRPLRVIETIAIGFLRKAGFVR